MKVTFVGTGTSFGVPVLGCSCATCRSDDPRDRRTRTGALVGLPDGTLLVDTPPELRMQLLAADAGRVDAVWFTHAHADHTHGIDDLRAFTALPGGGPIPAYVPEAYVNDFEARFAYIFDPSVRPPPGSSKPRVILRPFSGEEDLDVLGARVAPLRVPHGDVDVYGFRVGGLGYVTDGKRLTPPVVERLRGVDVLVLNALWFGKPHPAHFTIDEAVAAAREVGAARTFLIHLTHRARHAELLERLPDGVEPAFDGLVVDV